MSKAKQIMLGLLALFAATAVQAQGDPAFDSSAFETTLTDGVTAAGGVAVAVAGLAAAVMAWGKIRKYFQKAG